MPPLGAGVLLICATQREEYRRVNVLTSKGGIKTRALFTSECSRTFLHGNATLKHTQHIGRVLMIYAVLPVSSQGL